MFELSSVHGKKLGSLSADVDLIVDRMFTRYLPVNQKPTNVVSLILTLLSLIKVLSYSRNLKAEADRAAILVRSTLIRT